MNDDLARSLRAWRNRLDPAEAGLPPGANRRAPGLRREEVAVLAGISVAYMIRLEQGRAQAPSPSVVSALARALHLDRAEAEHLHRLAGHADPAARFVERSITPSLQRILDRLIDMPVILLDPAWTIVAANSMAEAFLGGDVVGANVARRQFLEPRWIEHAPEDRERFERDIVGDLNRQIADHPDDPALRGLVDQLIATSDRFAALWTERPANYHASSRKTIHHPLVGDITVDCDVLEVTGSDLRIIVWTAAPGTSDADALTMLGAITATASTTTPSRD